MSMEVQVDALPYGDKAITRDMRESIEAMIDAEMRTFSAGDYLACLPAAQMPQVSEMLRQEMTRVEQNRPAQGIDRSRFEIVPPTDAHQQDMNAWTQSVQNARAQQQHQVYIVLQNIGGF